MAGEGRSDRGHRGTAMRQLGGVCQAGKRRQQGPAVAARWKADGAHRPSWRHGHRPLYVRRHSTHWPAV